MRVSGVGVGIILWVAGAGFALWGTGFDGPVAGAACFGAFALLGLGTVCGLLAWILDAVEAVRDKDKPPPLRWLKCKGCGARFEESADRPAIATCPNCRRPVVAATGV